MARESIARSLRPSGALLAAHIALDAAIKRGAVERSEHDSTTLDLLLRLDLSDAGSLRSVELCQQLMLSPSHVSRMIDKLEAKGLAVRRPDPDDRRAQQVVITDEGRAAVGSFAPDLAGVIDRVIGETLDDGEVEQLIDMLTRIEHAARRDDC